MVTPPNLHEVKKLRGDRSALACLKTMVAQIESGELIEPDTIVIVSGKRETNDKFSVDVRGSSPNSFDLFGLIEIGKLHMWESLSVR